MVLQKIEKRDFVVVMPFSNSRDLGQKLSRAHFALVALVNAFSVFENAGLFISWEHFHLQEFFYIKDIFFMDFIDGKKNK